MAPGTASTCCSIPRPRGRASSAPPHATSSIGTSMCGGLPWRISRGAPLRRCHRCHLRRLRLWRPFLANMEEVLEFMVLLEVEVFNPAEEPLLGPSSRSSARKPRRSWPNNKAAQERERETSIQQGRKVRASMGAPLSLRSGKQRIVLQVCEGGRGACDDVCPQGRSHACQFCLGPHPNSECSQKGKKGGKGKGAHK